MKLLHSLSLLAALALFSALPARAADRVSYPAKEGPGKGKHLVFVTGDEEYRSEEGLPMLAKILSQRLGFKATVLFSLGADGAIDPNNHQSISGAAEFDTADAVIILTRFREWAEPDLKHFTDAVNRGIPIVGLRTSTHAFTGATNKSMGDFGKSVFGEKWVSHWGKHKSEATRAVVEPAAVGNPILNGVGGIFVLSDVYEAYPPADATILLRGQVLSGMTPDSAPADYKKTRSTDKQEQGVNDPMMPIAWTREHQNPGGKANHVFCTTMGAATDLENESLRRLIVNAVFWGLDLPVPAKANVDYVDPYSPSFYSFGANRKGLRPEDLELGKEMPGAPSPKPASALGGQAPAAK